jgi:hypothetical protein
MTMAKQIDVSSFECDCGHQLHFFENTIREMMANSYRRPEGIGEGDDKHAAIFFKGEFVAIYCPKLKAEIPATSASGSELATHRKSPRRCRQGQETTAQAQPEIDRDKLDEVVMALLSLTIHDENAYGARAWKGHDWDVLARLHEKGWIGDPVGKAKSVTLGPEDVQRARALFQKWFGK